MVIYKVGSTELVEGALPFRIKRGMFLIIAEVIELSGIGNLHHNH